MSQHYTLQIYTRRHQAHDPYTLTHTETGWELEGPAHNGNCDKTGAPYVFESLHADEVQYPESLEDALKHLWHQAATGPITQTELQ